MSTTNRLPLTPRQSNIFRAALLGSAPALSPQPMAGFFLLFDSDFARFSTGAPVSGHAARDLVYLRRLSDSTGTANYFLSNPGPNPANITATLHTLDNTAAGTAKTATIPPRGQFAFAFNDKTESSGFVHVTSDQPVAGIELFGGKESLTALDAVSPGSDSRLFLPHIAVNQGFTTMVGLVNPTIFLSNVILTAYDENGTVLGTPYLFTLNGNSQFLQSASTVFGLGANNPQSGYVVAQCDLPGMLGFVAFSFDAASRRSTTALPSISLPSRRLVFSHVAHQIPAVSGRTHQTGLALLNPFGAPGDYTITVFDRAGAILAQKSLSLGPHQKISKYLSHSMAGAGFFSQAIPLQGGHIEVTSEYGLVGLELFFTEDFSQLAGIAAQCWTPWRSAARHLKLWPGGGMADAVKCAVCPD